MSKIGDKVSIVTVTYNCVEIVESTILSVLNQTYPDKEYIIVDGGSTDGTVDIIRKYESKLTHWISEPDKGIYDAMNKGIELASGDWINFMNAGDLFYDDNVISDIFSADSSNTDIIYGDTLIMHQNFAFKFNKSPVDLIWKKTPFIHQSAFIKMSLMKDYRYDLTYRIGGDHDFFYRAFKAGKVFRYLDLIVCKFDGRSGTTKDHIILAIKDKMNIALKYDNGIQTKLYYHLYIFYIRLNRTLKAIIGRNFILKIKMLIQKYSK